LQVSENPVNNKLYFTYKLRYFVLNSNKVALNAHAPNEITMESRQLKRSCHSKISCK